MKKLLYLLLSLAVLQAEAQTEDGRFNTVYTRKLTVPLQSSQGTLSNSALRLVVQDRYTGIFYSYSRLDSVLASTGGGGINVDTSKLVYITKVYNNPTWLNSLAWSKITGAPNFLTSFTEVDPTVAAHVKAITEANITGWNAAVPSGRTITINGTTYDLTANRSWTIPTGITSETDPLYTANGVPQTRTITINGVTLDLSANRTFTVSASQPSVPAGQIVRGSGTGFFYDGNFTFDGAQFNLIANTGGATGVWKNLDPNGFTGLQFDKGNGTGFGTFFGYSNALDEFRINNSTGAFRVYGNSVQKFEMLNNGNTTFSGDKLTISPADWKGGVAVVEITQGGNYTTNGGYEMKYSGSVVWRNIVSAANEVTQYSYDGAVLQERQIMGVGYTKFPTNRIIIGSYADNGTNRLQVHGSSRFYDHSGTGVRMATFDADGVLGSAAMPATGITSETDPVYTANGVPNTRTITIDGVAQTLAANRSFTSATTWANVGSKPTTLSGFGITDAVPSARTLTINGTTFDLTANRTWTIAAGITGTGTTGQVPYFTGASAIGNMPLYYDATNLRWGFNKGTPTATIDVEHTETVPFARFSRAGDTRWEVRDDGGFYSKFLNDNTGVAKMVTVTNGVAGTATIPTGSGTETDPVYSANGVPRTRTITIDGTALDLSANRTFTSAPTFANVTAKPTTVAGYGITDAVPTARTITINGTAQDLTANRSWTVTAAGDGIYGGGEFVSQTVYTTGTGTYVVPANITKIRIIAVGGGGGGGGVTGTANNASAAGGGAAGGYVESILTVTPGASYTYAVGAAGTAGANTGGSGGAGGNTSFSGNSVAANGGSGGTGNIAGTAIVIVGGGTGGTASGTGHVLYSGQAGDYGTRLSATIVAGGAGGRGPLGTGGAATINAVGNAATGYGAGGSGASAVGANPRVGGVGTGGIIIIEQFR